MTNISQPQNWYRAVLHSMYQVKTPNHRTQQTDNMPFTKHQILRQGAKKHKPQS